MAGYSLSDGEDLATERATAIRALKPFVACAKDRSVDAPEWRDTDTVQIVVTIGDLRAALAADDPLI